MNFTPLSIPGAHRIELDRKGDARGFFARLFCADEFAAHGLATHMTQMNTSYTAARGTVRGLHFQRPPKAEAKVVRCLRGAIFDVLLDLRPGPTFGRHVSAELTEDNRSMLYIPEGCAHGFQTLTEDTELLYLHSERYAPEFEGGVHHADPALGIAWPLPPANLSPRDTCFPPLAEVAPL